jgi:hypothetical protein
MKRLAVLFFAAASLCLLGCPEEKASPDPAKAAATTKSTSGAAPSPTTTAKAAEPAGGW